MIILHKLKKKIAFSSWIRNVSVAVAIQLRPSALSRWLVWPTTHLPSRLTTNSISANSYWSSRPTCFITSRSASKQTQLNKDSTIPYLSIVAVSSKLSKDQTMILLSSQSKPTKWIVNRTIQLPKNQLQTNLEKRKSSLASIIATQDRSANTKLRRNPKMSVRSMKIWWTLQQLSQSLRDGI